MNTFHVRKTGDVILLHLGKDDDMLQCLNQAITEHKIKNGAVVSMIGTLDKARYHMIQTTEDDPTNGFYTVEGPIEVAAGQGLIIDGEPHIHICIDVYKRQGNPYVEMITHHMPLLDAMRTASRKAFARAFC